MKTLFVALTILLVAGFTWASRSSEPLRSTAVPLDSSISQATAGEELRAIHLAYYDVGQCIGDCGSEQGICIGACNGNGQCISRCAEAHGRCVARCHR